MEPSKEFDELFQEMRIVERSHEARRTSLMKIHNRLSKKKNHTVPIFLTLILVAASIFLIVFLVNPNFNENQAGVIDKEKKDSENSIQKVIEKEFTAPDKEYVNLFKEMANKELINPNEPAIKEREALQAYKEETYQDYFTENGLINFISSTPAFFYHREGKKYELNVKEIEIHQEKDQPTIYKFTFQVILEEGNGETSTYNFKGEAICPEEGKIGKIMYGDDMSVLSTRLLEMENE